MTKAVASGRDHAKSAVESWMRAARSFSLRREAVLRARVVVGGAASRLGKEERMRRLRRARRMSFLRGGGGGGRGAWSWGDWRARGGWEG